MSNRNLSGEELEKAWVLLDQIKDQINTLAGQDEELLFAYTRKIGKELSYFERGKPSFRKKLKREKMEKQDGCCAICKLELPKAYNVLDRLTASGKYTLENTRLLCVACDTSVQRERNYR